MARQKSGPQEGFISPNPGDIITYDYRSQRNVASEAETIRPLKLFQWNIERGYKLDKIIKVLQKADADVISLQEIDVHNERSNWEDTGKAIASALGMSYAVVVEFQELHSPIRSCDAQGGGYHGNAILSKFEIRDPRAVEHSHHPIDWENPEHKLAKKEPRKGRRLTAAATVVTPQGPLLVYSAHLECFCGALSRFWQLSDIFRDSRAHSAAIPYQVIMGDLNTLANGVARLSPNYCTDSLRLLSLGWFEAELLDKFILQCQSPNLVNKWLQWYGLPEQVCRDAVNPGFSDPFDSRQDITFDHPAYRFFGFHLMTGKFDWLLLKNAEVISKEMGNEDYSASDHKWLSCIVNFKKEIRV
mmetsp:Transcript_34770/g.62574  ORF Transcript_34770/g.62574 Transcript_34770/m.62574 type:complete len:358 (+) Transcript_34770:254-1327(+)|eukprot:CAMPEP_0175040944 /NCGR_PEP_ID=MMETSP0052_2-20121109/1601_1 /TAXON_ID=51329 ORGANISM="Polytomella parva, Strain SAG 63-3" /NCGR_SAMPLE_ID=MMETSP0052_2 /ASSEMBLY_ACC=CAM_ASM_000194 /LENGTH=357 /DNA_ID=CAMNT_0016303325 /DNA_START=244 /DNA_END=1317 /DNA_ORIENTATION=+